MEEVLEEVTRLKFWEMWWMRLGRAASQRNSLYQGLGEEEICWESCEEGVWQDATKLQTICRLDSHSETVEDNACPHFLWLQTFSCLPSLVYRWTYLTCSSEVATSLTVLLTSQLSFPWGLSFLVVKCDPGFFALIYYCLLLLSNGEGNYDGVVRN